MDRWAVVDEGTDYTPQRVVGPFSSYAEAYLAACDFWAGGHGASVVPIFDVDRSDPTP